MARHVISTLILNYLTEYLPIKDIYTSTCKCSLHVALSTCRSIDPLLYSVYYSVLLLLSLLGYRSRLIVTVTGECMIYLCVPQCRLIGAA